MAVDRLTAGQAFHRSVQSAFLTGLAGASRSRAPTGMQAYLDTAIEDMEAGRWEGIVGALLYPARPASAETLAMIEAVAGEQAVQVTWYHDVDWRP